MTTCEDNDPALDTSDWIPIVPDNTKAKARENTSSDRILNIDSSGDEFLVDEKLAVKKSYNAPYKLRKNSHIKRSPNQRTRIKLEQPYRYENILSPPPKQQLRAFQQKSPYQQSFDFQPQYQLNLPKPSHIVTQDAYQQFPLPSNPSIYNPTNLQNIPKYSSAQLGIQYQQPNIVHQVTLSNDSIFQQSAPGSIKQGLFENTLSKNVNQNIEASTQLPPVIKDTVQLLYVPLEQLQQKQGINSGILDEAFKSLQQQKLVARPPTIDSNSEQPESAKLFTQQGFSQHNVKQQQQYSIKHNQPITKGNEENRQQQYYVIQNAPLQNQGEEPRYYELLSKNRGELILQNNPRIVEVSNKQEYQVQAEKQHIVELTSPQPISSHLKNQEGQFRETKIQNTRNNLYNKEPIEEQSFIVQNQVSQPFPVESSKLQSSYRVQNQYEKPINNNYYHSDFKTTDQQLGLSSIHKDISQQNLKVKDSQKHIQQGKSIDFKEKNISHPPKTRKPHQPPLAVYMEGNSAADVEAVLGTLKNAKSIAVQDQFRPNSPQVFIGPSNLIVPEGFAKFPLPYLSNLDNNRIQRKAQQFPFFVAPINYKEPEGYSKIPLPSPHIGSVVISQFNQKQIPNYRDNRPVAITNYKFVNPAFESVIENNSNFDENLNAYSLDNGNPRDNTQKYLKEKTLLQQITGFSGSDFPQQQYNAEEILNGFNREQETFSLKPHSNQGQYLEEVYQKPESGTIEEIHQETPPEIVSPSPNKHITRKERVRGSKKSSKNREETSIPENSEKKTEAKVLNSENIIPEIPTPNIVQAPEKVEVSSQNPVNQDFFNRFSSNNNFNFNYVSSTPGYAIPTQNIFDESPANVRKLIPNTNNNSPDGSNSQAIDAQFEQSIQSLQKNKNKDIPHQQEERIHIYNQYEQFELPPQLTDINPNLPGLINGLQHQNQFTTLRNETELPISTTPSVTTQYSIRTTDLITPTSTTIKRPRGRGRSRFNMRTTTSAPYRRSCGDRRRPCKTSVPSTSETTSDKSFSTNKYQPIENQRIKPRTRLQNTMTDRVADGSIESTSPSQQFLQPSAVINENSELKDNDQRTKTIGFVEQYQIQKVTKPDELSLQEKEHSTLRQIPIIKPDISKQVNEGVTQKPTETERTTRRRVRVRGRPTNKYVSTTVAPRFSSTPENEQTEFYGFIRQPNFSKSSQISSNIRNDEENIHIYAPTQERISFSNQQTNEPLGPSSPIPDTQAPHFIGELRSKYTSPPRASTTQLPSSLPKRRIGSRVKVPGRNYESRSKTTDNTPTEKSTRIRTRGRTHFTSSRNIRQETDNEETENYPAPFLKSKEAATTPSSSEFKITVSMDDDKEDQISNPAINITEINRQAIELSQNPLTIQEETKNPSHDDEFEETGGQVDIVSFRDMIRHGNAKQNGFRVVNFDQFDTAESQNYRSLFNTLDSPHKVNDLKSKEIEDSSTLSSIDAKLSEEIEETSTVIPEYTSDKSENFFTTTEISKLQSTSLEDISSTILNSLEETVGDATIAPVSITTEPKIAVTTEDIRETQNMSSTQSVDLEITSTMNTDELETNTTVQTKSSEQTPIDLLNLQTSTSTEVSHETEICYKGKCVKSKNRKFRKRLLRKKVNESNL